MLGFALSILSTPPVFAGSTSVFTNLNTVGPGYYDIFGLGDYNDGSPSSNPNLASGDAGTGHDTTFTANNSTVGGNVGVALGSVNLADPLTIAGSLYLDQSASGNANSASGVIIKHDPSVNGPIDMKLDSAADDAYRAQSFYAAETATTFTESGSGYSGGIINITNPGQDVTFTYNKSFGAINVIDLSTLTINSGDTLTLSGGGDPNAAFLFNITGSGTSIFSEGGTIETTNGLDPLNVLYNFTNTDEDNKNNAKSSGNGSFAGILLDPYGDPSIDATTLNGEIIGDTVTFVSGAHVSNTATPEPRVLPAPEPSFYQMGGLLGLGALGHLRRRLRAMLR